MSHSDPEHDKPYLYETIKDIPVSLICDIRFVALC
jgi:hypothetical protein